MGIVTHIYDVSWVSAPSRTSILEGGFTKPIQLFGTGEMDKAQFFIFGETEIWRTLAGNKKRAKYYQRKEREQKLAEKGKRAEIQSEKKDSG
jgi:hypothetical protein